MPHFSSRSLALSTVIAICCFCFRCSQAQVLDTTSQQRFLSSLWSQRFQLANNQTLNETQFVRALADLRIGSFYNATAGCSASNWTGVGSNSSAAVDTCLTSQALAQAFGLNVNLGLTQRNFADIAVALVQQQLSGACIRQVGGSEGNGTTPDPPSEDKKWAYIYGTIAVTVISVLSCLGCVLVSCQRRPWFKHVMLFLVELAIGSLVGEALLHLLPTVVMNKHGHEHGGEERGKVPANFMKLVSAVIAICVLHAIDTGSSVAGIEDHSHNPPAPASSSNYSNHHQQVYSVSMAEANGSHPGERHQPAVAGSTEFSFSNKDEVKPVRLWDLVRAPKLFLRSPVRLCLFLMLSDALHNFADGVAIGAAFVHGNSDGLRLSISIGIHELAHELADFGVLLSCGFSMGASVLINFLCTFTCFCGLYIAIPLSESFEEATLWILAVAAAMFLYIAFVTLTNLVRDHYKAKRVTAFIVGNLGLIVGFLSVIAVSMYEIFG